MSKKIILKTQHLCRNFGALKATDDVSFELPEGEVRAVIGPNGAGKSTLMDVILHRTPASGGKVFFYDREITKLPAHKIARMGLYKCFQITNLFPRLTVFQNVQIALLQKHGKLYDFLPKKDDYLHDEAKKVLSYVNMEDHMEEAAMFLSYGDQRRLEIAVTLAMEPKLLFLDEPTAGVARAEGYTIMQTVRELAKERGITVVFIEHDMDIVFKYADTISILDHGQLIATDVPSKIRENSFVQAAYMGRH